MMKIDEQDRLRFIRFQREEITAKIVYEKLAMVEKDPSNKKVLQEISDQEQKHYNNLKGYTGMDAKPFRREIFKYYWLAKLLGTTFAIKFMETGEESSRADYAAYTKYPGLEEMAKEEESHEEKLIAIINEERLYYIGAIVLGLNDALVEFTGALAGYTLALNDHKLIALTGSITGVAASLSMASSEYLSTKSEGETGKRPIKSSLYTGVTYLITVVALIMPFVLFANVMLALGIMLLMAIFIIGIFNYYYSVTRDGNFKKRFGEMAFVSLGVALISFLIGIALKKLVGVDA